MQTRRTKIIATLGPATDSPEVLRALIEAGADVLRINLSHGSHAEQAARASQVRVIASELKKEVAILADLRGPKVRIESFVNGHVELEHGDVFILDASDGPVKGTQTRVGVTYKGLVNDVSVGDLLLLDDGLLTMRVVAIKGTDIVCEVEKTTFKLQEKALKLFTDIGMRIRYMDPVSHDKHIAYVSHLSHISAFMLGKTVIDKEKNERDIFDMAGSGFASTVRLAKSSPAMWTPIFKQNKENVIETLEEYINNLQHFKELMQQDNFSEIFNEMENTNYIKQILNGIK